MENCNTVKKVVLNFTDVSSLGPSSEPLLLRRRAKARNVSKVKYYFFTLLQFSIYLSFYLLYTDAGYTSLLASFHLQ